jgi:cell division protein ZapA (FtsZ GTPase activity inhibitor)
MVKPKLKFNNVLSVISAFIGIIGFLIPDLKTEIKIILFAILLSLNLIFVLIDYVKQVSKLFDIALSKEKEYTELRNRHEGLSKLFDERISELDNCKSMLSNTELLLFSAINIPNEYEKPQLINIYKFITTKGGSHEQRNI